MTSAVNTPSPHASAALLRHYGIDEHASAFPRMRSNLVPPRMAGTLLGYRTWGPARPLDAFLCSPCQPPPCCLTIDDFAAGSGSTTKSFYGVVSPASTATPRSARYLSRLLRSSASPFVPGVTVDDSSGESDLVRSMGIDQYGSSLVAPSLQSSNPSKVSSLASPPMSTRSSVRRRLANGSKNTSGNSLGGESTLPTRVALGRRRRRQPHSVATPASHPADEPTANATTAAGKKKRRKGVRRERKVSSNLDLSRTSGASAPQAAPSPSSLSTSSQSLSVLPPLPVSPSISTIIAPITAPLSPKDELVSTRSVRFDLPVDKPAEAKTTTAPNPLAIQSHHPRTTTPHRHHRHQRPLQIASPSKLVLPLPSALKHSPGRIKFPNSTLVPPPPSVPQVPQLPRRSSSMDGTAVPTLSPAMLAPFFVLPSGPALSASFIPGPSLSVVPFGTPAPIQPLGAAWRPQHNSHTTSGRRM